jgi:hypothetical protein
MPRLDTASLAQRLYEAGIAPRHIKRTITELDDHFDDLVEELAATGLPGPDAEAHALRRIGSAEDLLGAMDEQPQLRCWGFRYPRIARVVYPIVYVALLPAFPLVAAVEHAPQIARWGICLMAGGVVTATMLLALRFTILFG